MPRAPGVRNRVGGGRLDHLLVAATATLFRRRWPRSTLAVVFPIAVAALALRAGGPIVFYVALALYCVVAVSSRRRAWRLPGSWSAGRWPPSSWGTVTAGPGRHRRGGAAAAGWLAGEYTRASRVYAAQQAEQAREAAAAEAEQAAQIRRAMADERAQIAWELHDIVAHAMSVIAVRSGVARMVIDTDPEPVRRSPSSRPPPVGHCTRCACWSACCGTPGRTRRN